MAPNHFLVAAGAYLFLNRSWQGKGFGKTAVVTQMVDKFCSDNGIKVYEVPVGFKYFSSLLFDGTIGIGGEESAGASFLKKMVRFGPRIKTVSLWASWPWKCLPLPMA